jgi:hypothetical protein
VKSILRYLCKISSVSVSGYYNYFSEKSLKSREIKENNDLEVLKIIEESNREAVPPISINNGTAQIQSDYMPTKKLRKYLYNSKIKNKRCKTTISGYEKILVIQEPEHKTVHSSDFEKNINNSEIVINSNNGCDVEKSSPDNQIVFEVFDNNLLTRFFGQLNGKNTTIFKE